MGIPTSHPKAFHTREGDVLERQQPKLFRIVYSLTSSSKGKGKHCKNNAFARHTSWHQSNCSGNSEREDITLAIAVQSPARAVTRVSLWYDVPKLRAPQCAPSLRIPVTCPGSMQWQCSYCIRKGSSKPIQPFWSEKTQVGRAQKLGLEVLPPVSCLAYPGVNG